MDSDVASQAQSLIADVICDTGNIQGAIQVRYNTILWPKDPLKFCEKSFDQKNIFWSESWFSLDRNFSTSGQKMDI